MGMVIILSWADVKANVNGNEIDSYSAERVHDVIVSLLTNWQIDTGSPELQLVNGRLAVTFQVVANDSHSKLFSSKNHANSESQAIYLFLFSLDILGFLWLA